MGWVEGPALSLSSVCAAIFLFFFEGPASSLEAAARFLGTGLFFGFGVGTSSSSLSGVLLVESGADGEVSSVAGALPFLALGRGLGLGRDGCPTFSEATSSSPAVAAAAAASDVRRRARGGGACTIDRCGIGGLGIESSASGDVDESATKFFCDLFPRFLFKAS